MIFSLKRQKNLARLRSWLLMTAILTLFHAPLVRAEEKAASASATSGRNFYEVLEELLGDFESDLRNGEVKGTRDLSIRNLSTSENIPGSFKQHLELAVTERILRVAKGTKLIQCLPCRAKRTTLTGDQMTISSPESNPAEMARIAKMSGISHFMDLAFSYQPTGMVLSFTTIDPETGTIVWSRSYNSETSRTAALKRGVDLAETDPTRRESEYQPSLQYRVGISYLFEPNATPNSATGCLVPSFRLVERYDNRRKEVGFEVNYHYAASLLGGTMTDAEKVSNIWGGINGTLLFVHAWNFLGGEENFNHVRGSAFGAIGGTYASGYLGGLVRAGYEWRLAKHWAVSTTLGYRPQATRFVGTTSYGAVTGWEYGISIAGLFW